MQGALAHWSIDLHQRYGPIVRIGPKHLAVDRSIGFRDILQHRPGKQEWAKVKGWYFPGGYLSLLGSGQR